MEGVRLGLEDFLGFVALMYSLHYAVKLPNILKESAMGGSPSCKAQVGIAIIRTVIIEVTRGQFENTSCLSTASRYLLELQACLEVYF